MADEAFDEDDVLAMSDDELGDLEDVARGSGLTGPQVLTLIAAFRRLRDENAGLKSAMARMVKQPPGWPGRPGPPRS